MAKKKLALSFFDDDETQNFFHILNPNISVPRRNCARRMVMEHFHMQRVTVKKILNNNCSKFSFTVDGWTSMNFRSYYGVTIHFIDDNWQLQSLALDFIPSCGRHCGKDIAEVFFKCIKEYGLENKIQGITLDNAAANTTFMSELNILMAENDLSFDNINQHFRCFAHILNLGVQDIMKMLKVDFLESESDILDSLISKAENIDDEKLNHDDLDEDELFEITSNDFSPSSAICKLRSTFIKIRKSEQLQNKLNDFCNITKTKYIKPILDVKTRWNSTHDMIEVGISLKNSLNLFWLSHENNERISMLRLSEDEWLLLEQIYIFLKNFKIVSNAICGEKYVTLPIVVVAFNILISDIESTIFELDNKTNRTIVDETLLIAFQASRDKMLKHYRKTNWVYCSSLILDPRHKVEIFEKTDWGKEMKNEAIQCFEKFYKKYAKNTLNDQPTEEVIIENDTNSIKKCIDINSLYKTTSKSSKHWKAEFEEYLLLALANRNQNILEWWKVHEKVFPTLSQMAKDLFSIMATSVPVERLFSTAGMIMTKTRTSLKDDVMQALLCLNSWSSSNLKDKFKSVK